MAIPNQALEKLVREIETQAIAAQQQIALARSQMTAKQREMRLVRLTLGEVAGLPADTNVYQGVGKMFIQLPASDLGAELQGRLKDAEADTDKLSKRLAYLETTHKNSMEHIDRMLKGGSGSA